MVGALAFQLLPKDLRLGGAFPGDGMALLLLLSLWAGSAAQEWQRKDQIKGMSTDEHTLLPLFHFLDTCHS